MKNFDKVILTNQGKNLLNKALSGTTLKFTKVVLGDGIQDDSINPEELTDLINPVINPSIREFTNLRNGTVKLKVVASNTKLDHDVFIREIGIYADDPDLGEILYSVTYLDEPYFIPEKLTKVISTIDVYTTISNAQKINAITFTDVREKISLFLAGQYTQDDLITELQNAGLTQQEIESYMSLFSEASEIAKLIYWIEQIWEYEEQIKEQTTQATTIEELQSIISNKKLPI